MDADEIIAKSRELRAVAVFLGQDSGSPRQLRRRLAELCQLVGGSEPGSLEHADYVSRYNSVLYKLMHTLEYEQEALPRESRLADDLILLDYLEYERQLLESGPETLTKLWSESDVVALVRTRRKRVFFRRRISMDLVRCYKGKYPKGYAPIREVFLGHCFQPKTRYIVFWTESGQEFSGSSWEIFRNTVLADHGARFWPFPVSKAYGSGVLVRWSALESWLAEAENGNRAPTE